MTDDKPTPFLAAYGVDAAAWADRHGIEPFTTPCEACGLPKTTTIPIAWGVLRGLMAPRCECGDTGHTYCLVGLLT